ncbi:MAG: efflux RND transporter periplasmic adaptor subunit [Woeseiaceae bacterium]
MRLITTLVAIMVAFAAGTANAEPVQVAVAEEQSIVNRVRVSGTITSPQASVLSPSVGGLISKMNVDAGDRVEAGDVVVELDRELAALELQRREAEMEQMDAALANARRLLDEAERVRSSSAIAETEIKSRQATVQTTSAALAAARAAVQQQRAVVARHAVRAPFDGVVSRRLGQLGEWIDPGTGVVELVATTSLRFDFRVPQEYFSSITPESKVELLSDAAPGFRAQGHIVAIVPVGDPNARTFLLRVEARDSDTQSITPGMSAQGIVYVDAGRRGVVVPRDAMLRYPDGRQVVWVVESGADGNAIVRERRVETGLIAGGVVEILSGVDAGTRVVTHGNETLQDGQAVVVQ